MKTTTIDIPLYNITVHVFVGGSSADIIKKFTSRKGEQGNPLRLSEEEKKHIKDGVRSDEGFVLSLELSTGHCLYYLKEYEYSPKLVGIFVHEIVHVVFNSFQRIGATVSDDTEEHFTHLAQHLTTELLEWLSPKKL